MNIDKFQNVVLQKIDISLIHCTASSLTRDLCLYLYPNMKLVELVMIF